MQEESRLSLYFHLVSLESNLWRDRTAARLPSLLLSLPPSPFRFFLPPDVYRRSRALCFRRFIFCPSAKYPPRRAAISGRDDQREKRAAPTPRFKPVVGGWKRAHFGFFNAVQTGFLGRFFCSADEGRRKSVQGCSSNYFYHVYSRIVGGDTFCKFA